MRNCLIVCAVFCLVWAHTLRAQLGQPQSSIRQLDSIQFKTSELHSAEGFRYHQYSSDDLVVKQFVNPTTNTVFGITWKGERMPSLLTLLGFDPYKISGPGVSRSLHVTHIRTETLSIDITALMGHYAGRAIRTDLLPKGVAASVVTP